jgi:hypothetical protein
MKFIIPFLLLLTACSTIMEKAFDRCETHFTKKNAKNLCANGTFSNEDFNLCCKQGEK